MKNCLLAICILIIGFFFITSCGSIDPKNYAQQQPTFDFKEFFNGPIKAWGIVQDRSGDVIRRFDVTMVGEWEGNKGVLKEKFYYYDGEEQDRTWYFTALGNGKYEGYATDIPDTASGQTFGSAGNWHYTMDLPVGDTTYRVKFDDWMWAMNDGAIFNRSYIKKFGLTMAQVTIFMKKENSEVVK